MGPQPRPTGAPGPIGLGAAQAAAVAPYLVKEREPAPPAPVVVEHRAPVSQIVQLIWFDADCMPRVRRTKAWKPILEALEERAADPDLDDPALAADAMQLEDRREMFEILAQGKQVGPDAIDRAMRDSVREDGKFVPPLVLSSGELEMRFDELETLKATTTTAEPLIIVKEAPKPPPPTSPDEPPPPPPKAPLDPLAVAVAKAKEFLKNPDLLSPPDVSGGLVRRIREAYAEEERSLPATYIEEQTDCVLLEKRHYQKRIVFGDTYLRSLWSPNPDEPPIPVYLPQCLTKKLPMYQRFEARWMAEAHPKEDQYEQADVALKVVALARVTRPKSRS